MAGRRRSGDGGRRGGYTFGEGEVPARRLALLAAVFEPTTRDFLADRGIRQPPLALDLGCGPGRTTASWPPRCGRTEPSGWRLRQAVVETPPR